jgi:three-Cys-motif partner protein
MTGIYREREQTEAKHFILKRYLQTLTFKILQAGFHSTLTYVDGFSGPWNSRTADHSDTSFMIAINVLKDAQQKVKATTGKTKRIRCFFCEENPSAFAQLQAAVAPHHDPANHFFIETFNGKFADAVPQIVSAMKGAFALTFIDPTGWTGYEFAKIQPVLTYKPGEVLLNFMYDFINRFTASADPTLIASFDGILGHNWQTRLDQALPREEALLNLFREEFAKAGNFDHVLMTPIEKVSARTHFHIVYGTRSNAGLAAYRDVEAAALRDHDMRRAVAKEEKSAQFALFPAAMTSEMLFEQQNSLIRSEAKRWVSDRLRSGSAPVRFADLWPLILENFALRVTDAKQICHELGKQGIIKESWKARGPRVKTPADDDVIELA